MDLRRAMNHDPDYYTDPLEFKPERFLDANGALLETMPDTHGYGHQTYGSGRRSANPYDTHFTLP